MEKKLDCVFRYKAPDKKTGVNLVTCINKSGDCNGCYFYDKKSELCKEPDFKCSDYEREDKKDVMFKRLLDR